MNLSSYPHINQKGQKNQIDNNINSADNNLQTTQKFHD